MPHEPPLAHLRHEKAVVSAIVPYTGLILSICCVLMFLLRYYILEPLAILIFKRNYLGLDPNRQRGTINHMMAVATKALLLLIASYPVIAIIAVRDFRAPLVPGSALRMGDALVVISEIFCAMYIFELLWRTQVSLIGQLHHIGAIVIAQSAIVLGFDPSHSSDAGIEFVLCLIWGFFDVLAEFHPHLAMLIYRYRPAAHGLNARVLRVVACTEVVSTTVETVVVMSLFGSLWHDWTLGLKIATPILHCLFSYAQLSGVRTFWAMAADEDRKAKGEVVVPHRTRGWWGDRWARARVGMGEEKEGETGGGVAMDVERGGNSTQGRVERKKDVRVSEREKVSKAYLGIVRK
ncbi:hypothetical protein CAC42_7006 [Sphaceloma murrayae]|uniref:Uncharacterized protein n=1 Tax=Sphaceloma murrayae TaxID=2082308 RepID=A0A2K1QR21_9PEZI|nr:hypothetical protein CAC42_7006 [Sphaceloma murrayae]